MPFSPEELSELRSQTPGVPEITLFNSAGSSLPPQSVLDVLTDFLIDEAREGGYEIMMSQADRLSQVYEEVARMIGAEASEIAFCTSSTDASYKALESVRWTKGDEILISRADYGANTMAYLMLRERYGVQVVLVEDNEYGEIDLDLLEQAITPRSKMILLTHMPTGGGLVNPAVAVGKIARKHKLLYLLDACQTVGQLPINVREIGCDFLTATGRKYLRGPRGTGFLFVCKESVEQFQPSRPDLWSAQWTSREEYEWLPGARRYENFEYSRALCLGLGEAARVYSVTGPEKIWTRIQQLASRLRSGLSQIPGVTVQDKGRIQGGIVTFTVQGQDADELQKRLMAERLQLSVSRQGTSWYDFPERGIVTMLRASVHYFLLEEDVDLLIEKVSAVAVT